jgi:hypothetical protein
MELGIEHGGWVSKGRETEKGALPKNHKPQEISIGHPLTLRFS